MILKGVKKAKKDFLLYIDITSQPTKNFDSRNSVAIIAGKSRVFCQARNVLERKQENL